MAELFRYHDLRDPKNFRVIRRHDQARRALLAHPSLGSVRRVQHVEPRVSGLEKIPERIGESAV